MQARGGVDQVPGDHPLVRRPQRDGRLTGQDAGSGAELLTLVPEVADRVHQLERSTHGPLGVVLVRHRCAPYRHYRVTDELLDGPSVSRHDLLGDPEVLGQLLANGLRIPGFGHGGKADQVGEEDRDELPLGHRACRSRVGCRRRGNGLRRHGWTAVRRRCLGCRGASQPKPAFRTEFRVAGIRCRARRACLLQAGAAFGAELLVRGRGSAA